MSLRRWQRSLLQSARVISLAARSQSTEGGSARCSELLHRDLIDVAPLPVFPWLEALDDGMLRAVEMGGRVFADRVVATTDVAASEAESEVDPAHSCLETRLAALGGPWSDVPDL